MFQKRESAQGMAEFALALPLLLFLIFGLMEFGRLLFYYTAITTGSREAARYGSAVGKYGEPVERYRNCAGIRTAAKKLGSFVGIGDGDVAISYDHGPEDPDPFSTCPVGGTGPSTVALKDRIVVTVKKPFKPVMPLVNLPAVNIQSTSRRTIVINVEVK